MKPSLASLVLLFGGSFIAASCTLALDEAELGAGCPAGQSYCAGECRASDDPACCAAGTKPCPGGCMALDMVATGCAEHYCAPCFFANAQAVCDVQQGGCALGACVGRYLDCNREAEDGCEVDSDFDADRCGACSHVCPELPNAERGCASGVCVISRCEVGYLDCDGRTAGTAAAIANGCEVNRFDDPKNCGDCGVSCGNANCVQGRCEY